MGWRTLPVTFERFDDALHALLGCGPLAEVIAPPELRESIRHAAAGLLALYAHEDLMAAPRAVSGAASHP
jgi:phage head maturation protease